MSELNVSKGHMVINHVSNSVLSLLDDVSEEIRGYTDPYSKIGYKERINSMIDKLKIFKTNINVLIEQSEEIIKDLRI